MNESGLTAADVLALTNNDNDSMSELWNNPFVYLIWMSTFNGRMGYFGNDVAGNGALTRAEMYEGFANNQIENGIRGIQNGLCDGFYGQNTTMLQGFNGIERGLCQGFNYVGSQLAENRFASQQCCYSFMVA